jgi:hypothetical protein
MPVNGLTPHPHDGRRDGGATVARGVLRTGTSARLTLARKIAAITLTLWKKEERFDAQQLKKQAA